MIDERKLQDAATGYAFEEEYSSTTIENIVAEKAFANGVKWFKEAIWHKAKEEPEEHKFIITQWLHEGEICYEADRTQPKVDWQNHVVENNIIKWCYIEDLLTKGGDK